jgi:hypothetical protein
VQIVCKTIIMITVKLYIDQRRKKASGKFPVKLRIYNGITKYYLTGIDLTDQDWNKIQKGSSQTKEVEIRLRKIEEKAWKIIQAMPYFSFELFEQEFTSKGGQKDVFLAFESRIKDLEQQDS